MSRNPDGFNIPPNHMQAFAAVMEPADHREANFINFHYDSLQKAHYGGEILVEAIALAEKDLAHDFPHAETFGYATARGAMRWWNYRNAYLQDLAPVYTQLDEISGDDPWQHGLEDVYESYTQKLEFMTQEQADAGTFLIDEDPMYTGTYAWLEKVRINRALANNIMLDPLRMEQEFSMGVLLNVLDSRMGPEAQPDERGVRIAKFETVLETEQGDMACEISRHNHGEMGTMYTITASGSLEHEGSEETDDGLIAIYRFVETEGTIVTNGESLFGPVMIDTQTVLQFANAFSGDTPIAFERSSLKSAETIDLKKSN